VWTLGKVWEDMSLVAAADPGGSLGSDEPPSGWVWWLKTLELTYLRIKVVQLDIFSLRLYGS